MTKKKRTQAYTEEFAILGFEFECELNCSSEDQFDEFMDEAVSFIESRNLNIGGGGNLNSFGGFICSNERYGSATVEDIASVKEWLAKQSLVSNIEMGELVDAMYGI